MNCVRQAPKTTGYRGSIEPIPSVPLHEHRNGRRRIPSRLCEQERLRERAHPASVGSGFLAGTGRKHWSPTTLKRCQADFPIIREVTVSICWTRLDPLAHRMAPRDITPPARDKSRALCYQIPAVRRGEKRHPDQASGMKRARACDGREPGRLDPGSAGGSPASPLMCLSPRAPSPGSAGVPPAPGRRPAMDDPPKAHSSAQAGKPAPAWGRRGMPALPGTTRTMLGSIAGARAFQQLLGSITR